VACLTISKGRGEASDSCGTDSRNMAEGSAVGHEEGIDELSDILK